MKETLHGKYEHYSSDADDTTKRKCVIQLLWQLNVGRKVLRSRGISINFAGAILKPGAYGMRRVV